MKTLSYISKGNNTKVNFTDRSLTLKDRILRDLHLYMIIAWDWYDHPLLELLSTKRTGLNNKMPLSVTLKNISSSIYNLDNLDEISTNKSHCNIDDQTAVSMIANHLEKESHKLLFDFLATPER